MKLLIATPLLPTQPGGPAQYTVGLRQALENKGHHVEVITFQEVARYPTGVRHGVLFAKAYLRMRDVDAVVVLDSLSIALPAVLAAFFRRKKIVVRTGGDFVWERYVERTREKIMLSHFYDSAPSLSLSERFALWLQKRVVIPLSHTIVFSTRWQWDIWQRPYGLEQRNVKVIENAYAPFPRHEEVSRDTSLIAWIGRDIPLKNVETLDRAIEMVKEDYPQVEYRKFSGISHGEVLSVLRRSRILVIPSFSEVSPNLALEALALGVPVILTQDCGLKDILRDAAIWVDPLDAENVALRIAELMTEEGYAKARTHVAAFQDMRTYDQVADEFIRTLQ